MSVESEEIGQLVRRLATVDGETGEITRGYIAVYGGSNSRGARKLAANIPITPCATDQDLARLVDAVMRRVSTARAEGPKKLYVRAYETGDSAPADVVVLEGDAVASREGDEDEGGGMAASMASALRNAMAENRYLQQQYRDLALEQRDVVIQAAKYAAEIEVRSEVGWHESKMESLQKTIEAVAPHVGSGLEKGLAIYALHAFAAAAPPEDGVSPTPDGRLRGRAAQVEKAATVLVAEMALLNASGQLTEAMKGEIAMRIMTMVANAQNMVANMKPPPPPPAQPTPNQGKEPEDAVEVEPPAQPPARRGKKP